MPDFDFDDSSENYGHEGDNYVYTGNDEVTGINYYPTLSTGMQTSNDTSFGDIINKLGSIGTTAAQIGTAVGTAQRNIAIAKGQYNAARNDAKNGNSLGTFWLYATPTEKAMIILAAVAIVVTVAK